MSTAARAPDGSHAARQRVTQRRDARRPGRSRTRCRSARADGGFAPDCRHVTGQQNLSLCRSPAWRWRTGLARSSRVGLRQPKQSAASCVFPGSYSAGARIGVYDGMCHPLRLTTVRQRERGRGRRRMPGLCPPDHVGPTAHAQDPSGPKASSMTLTSRGARVTRRSRVSRGTAAAAIAAIMWPTAPALRRRSCAGNWLPARLGGLAVRSWRNTSSADP
jgi:hypothetical protein